MPGALLALLLVPFAGAALAVAVPRLGVDAGMTGLCMLGAALALSLYLLAGVGDGPPVLLAAAWVPALDLGFSAHGDRLGLLAAAGCLLLGLAIVWRLRAAARPGRAPAARVALVLGCGGVALVQVLATSLPLLAGAAVLGAIGAFALAERPAITPPSPFDRAGWVLLVRIAGAFALLAAGLLLADVTGSSELDVNATAAPALRAQPLFGLATALLWVGGMSFAGAWPFSRWLWRGGRGAALADPLLAAAGVTLALRFAPLLPGAWPRIAIAPALLAAPLLVAAVGRVLDDGSGPTPAGQRRG